MITRELLNKLGKARAEEHVAPNSGDYKVHRQAGFNAGFTSALDLLFPGVEVIEITKNIKTHDHLNWAQKMACEFLAKLERELA